MRAVMPARSGWQAQRAGDRTAEMFGFKINARARRASSSASGRAWAQPSDCQTQDTAGRARPETSAAPGDPPDIGSALQGP
jgi:hypothetical protein